jgi:signal transduction histidine kinase
MVIGSISRLHQQLNGMIMAQLEADARRLELILARQQMQALNDRMRIATQTAKAGVWEWNVETQRQEWDAQVYQMYDILQDSGPSSYEAWRSRVHPQDLPRVEAVLRQGVAEQDEFTTEFRVLWADGTERFIKTSCIVQRDAQRRATHVIGMNWDITDLRRVDRMKSEFVSIVSHELRTPLTSIRGALGLLRGGAIGEIAERGQQLLQLASRNADRLAVLIDDLLDIEKIESGKLRFELERQPLLPLLEQSIAGNSTYAEMQSVTFGLRGVTASEVDVDTNRLLQVLTNLLSNAAKFSPKDGVVTIAAREIGMRVRVEVHDDGPGVSPEFQAKIFGKFCQGDSSDTRSRGGSGLGLAISKAIIEQMNGTIGFETAPGAGSTFYFDLPLRDGSGEPGHDQTTVILPTLAV